MKDLNINKKEMQEKIIGKDSFPTENTLCGKREIKLNPKQIK